MNVEHEMYALFQALAAIRIISAHFWVFTPFRMVVS